MKRILAIVLALASLLSMTACQSDQDPLLENKADYAAHAADADVWCALASKQILATETAESYADVRLDKIYLDAVKNEYETAQIIVSAKKDLKFTVTVSDLQHTEDSGAYISGENCSVYIQKYIGVGTNWHGNGAPTGEYPDALLPQENAVEYEQNIVKAGKNGGAWLKFYIPKDAKAGNYTGKAIVDLGAEQVSVDISLKVYEVKLPDRTTSKSFFTINTGMMRTYELDSTTDIYNRYTQFLIDHRLAPTSIWTREELREEGDSDMRVWAKTAYYWYEKGLNTIGLKAGMATVDGYSFLDMDTMKECLYELAVISLEKNVDLVDLAALYDYPIDEPFFVKYSAEHVQSNIDHFNEAVNAVADELATQEAFQTEFGRQIVESVRNTPHVVTDYYGDEFRHQDPMVFEDGTKFSYEGQRVTLCPKYDDYNTQQQRDQYDLPISKEKWWYTCNVPSYPYPGYHTDDTPVSAMSIGWMMAQYGVVGNLYWVINYWYLNNSPVEDPYSLVYTGSGANGDGTIVYPGRIYGVDGPVGTVRTSAILDGNEDYELLKYIIESYKEKGLNADAIIDRITASVYNGTKMVGGSAEFEEARRIMLAVAEACASDTQLMVTAIEEQVDADDRKTYAFTIHADPEAKLYQNGTELTGKDGSYFVVCGLEEQKNYLNIKAVKGDSECEFAIYLGGMQKIYNADSFTEAEFSGSFISAQNSNGIYDFKFDGIEKNSITITHSSQELIGKDTLNYIWKVLNNGDEASYKIYVTYEKFGRVEFASGTLPAGESEINMNTFATVNWDRNGKMVNMEIVITGSDNVGISQIIYYGS